MTDAAALHPDRSAVLLDERLADGQAQSDTASGFLGREEQLEHVGEMLCKDPASGVAHGHDDAPRSDRAPLKARPDLDPTRLLDDGIEGVVHEVQPDLAPQ